MQPQNPYYYGVPEKLYAQPKSQAQSGADPQSAPGPVGVPTPTAVQGVPAQPSIGAPTEGANATSTTQGGAIGPLVDPWSGRPEQWVGQAATPAQGVSQRPSTQGGSQHAQPQGGGQQLPPQQGGAVSAGPAGQAATAQQPYPLIDVVEDPAAIEVVVNLPGFDEDDIQLNADAQTLHVSAQRTPDEEDEDRVAIQRERPVKVERVITIPVNVELDEASAVYDDGVCHVTLPKSEDEMGTQTKIGFH